MHSSPFKVTEIQLRNKLSNLSLQEPCNVVRDWVSLPKIQREKKLEMSMTMCTTEYEWNMNGVEVNISTYNIISSFPS